MQRAQAEMDEEGGDLSTTKKILDDIILKNKEDLGIFSQALYYSKKS